MIKEEYLKYKDIKPYIKARLLMTKVPNIVVIEKFYKGRDLKKNENADNYNFLCISYGDIHISKYTYEELDAICNEHKTEIEKHIKELEKLTGKKVVLE